MKDEVQGKAKMANYVDTALGLGARHFELDPEAGSNDKAQGRAMCQTLNRCPKCQAILGHLRLLRVGCAAQATVSLGQQAFVTPQMSLSLK